MSRVRHLARRTSASAWRSTGASTISPRNANTPASVAAAASTSRRPRETFGIGAVPLANNRDLRRMDARGRGEPERRGVVDLGAQAVEVADVEVHRVDRGDVVRGRREAHLGPGVPRDVTIASVAEAAR